MSEIKITDRFDRKELNAFIRNNQYASIFQTTEMAEVYDRNLGAEPITLVVLNEDTGEIVASLLAKILDEKKGLLGSLSRHSSIRGGPIFDNDMGLKSIPSLLDDYNNYVRKRNVLYSRIYPLEDTRQAFSFYEENGYTFETWNNFLINLNVTKDELWSNIKKDKKTGVKKARKQGVKFREIESKDELPRFYDLVHNRFSLRKNPLEDISNFEAVYDILVSKGMAKFFFAEYDGKCIATRLVLLFQDKMYAWYSGSDNDYLKLYPNDFITWSVLEWGHDNGYKLFDFGGGGLENETNAGWVQFKQRFGSYMVNYGRYTYVHKPLTYVFAKNAFNVYRQLL